MNAPIAAQAQRDALRQYFAGDQALFDAFFATCIAQLPLDLAQGDAACLAADWPALRRTAHNLKSVLLMLGYPQLSEDAFQCEEFSQQGLAEVAASSWHRLHAGIVSNFLSRYL